MFNTHFPLVGHARAKAATLFVQKIYKLAEDEPVILAGDLNCGPNSKPRNILRTVGLVETDESHNYTYHLFGYGLISLDAIMVNHRWIVKGGDVIRKKGESGYPSDHFGVFSNLRLSIN